MKKLFFAAAMILFTTAASAQTITNESVMKTCEEMMADNVQEFEKYVFEVYEPIMDLFEKGEASDQEVAAKIDELEHNDIYMMQQGIEPEQAEDGFYLIADAYNLLWLSRQTNAGNRGICARLVDDIDLSVFSSFPSLSLWRQDGINGPAVDGTMFAGVIDGQGHVIRNMRIRQYEGYEAGFISRAWGATVRNLGFENPSVENSFSTWTGVLAGEFAFGTLQNCWVTGNIGMEADPAKAYGSLDAAFARVKAKCLVVSYGGDVLFTEWQSREMVASLMKAGKDVSYCHLDYGIGHDAFLTHIDELSKLVGGFLSSREVKVMKWQERLYANIVRMVPRGARVLDIGCGDGSLLNVLRKTRNVKGDGVEIEVEKFEEALADGHNVLYDDVDDDGIDMIPDRHYSTAIVSDTLQEVRNPRGLLHEALRIADEAIVTFPNFAAYRIRLTLMFKGRLPVSKQLPFEWYDTPNIHLITLKDFQALCDKEGIEIVETRAESRHPLGRIMLLLGMKNLGASKIIAKVRKRA